MEIFLNDLMKSVRKLKKLMREQKKETKIFEEFIAQTLLAQKSVFKEHVEVPVVGTVNSETGEINFNKPIEAPDIVLEDEVNSPKDVPGYENEINIPEPSGLN
jgi:hypothetical protein